MDDSLSQEITSAVESLKDMATNNISAIQNDQDHKGIYMLISKLMDKIKEIQVLTKTIQVTDQSNTLENNIQTLQADTDRQRELLRSIENPNY